MDKYDELAKAIHGQPKASTPGHYSTRDMTSLDDLTHNFVGDPDLTAHFLRVYGQGVIGNKRFTA